VAKISLIRTYRVFSSGSGRRRKDGCGSDGRSGLGVAGNSPARRFTFKPAILTPRPRMRGPTAGGAGSFLAAAHGLDSCELDCGLQILSRDPVTFVFSAQRVSGTGRIRVDGTEDSFSTKAQVVLSAPETRPGRTSGRIVDILPAMNGGDSYGVPAGFAGISGLTATTALLQRRTTKRLNFRAIRP